MDTLQTEPASVPGPTHPWNKNSDGSGINYWRIDAHEESTATIFRFQDIRLAADHKADSKFLIVLDGDRDKQVALYYSGRSDGTQGTLIGTVPAGRNTDTYLWNTSNVPEGTWFLYLVVGSETYTAPGQVVVSHQGEIDSANPILSVDAPLNGHRFTDSLEIAGFAVDNLRIATVEAFLDGQLISSFRPSQYRKAARDAYPALPFSADSGFQFNVAIANSVSMGNHTFTLKAYDTSGNLTQYDTTVQKVGSDPTAAVSYPVPNESRFSVPIAAPAQPTAVPTSAPGADLSLRVRASSTNIDLSVGNAGGCSSLEVLANVSPNKDRNKIINKKPQTLYSGSAGSGAVSLRAQKVKSLGSQSKKTDTNVYIVARCDGVRYSTIAKLDAKKVKRSKAGTVKNVKSFVGHLKSRLKPA